MEDDGWIQIARASAHYDAFQWGQTHRSINRLTATNCSYRTTVAQVAGDHVSVCKSLPSALAASRETYRWLVLNAVTTDAVLTVQLLWDGVGVSHIRHGLVNAVSNTATCGRAPKEACAARIPIRAAGLCSGAKKPLFDAFNHFISDQHRAGVFLAAVYYTVTYSNQLLSQFRF